MPEDLIDELRTAIIECRRTTRVAALIDLNAAERQTAYDDDDAALGYALALVDALAARLR